MRPVSPAGLGFWGLAYIREAVCGSLAGEIGILGGLPV